MTAVPTSYLPNDLLHLQHRIKVHKSYESNHRGKDDDDDDDDDDDEVRTNNEASTSSEDCVILTDTRIFKS